MFRICAFCLFSVFCFGCASQPTKNLQPVDDVQDDWSLVKPENPVELAERYILERVKPSLLEPESIRYRLPADADLVLGECRSRPTGSTPAYRARFWSIPIYVTGKNTFGGYAPMKASTLYFKNGQAIGHSKGHPQRYSEEFRARWERDSACPYGII